MLPVRPGQPERHTHDYKRNGTTSADSSGFRTPVPIQFVHPFRSNPYSVPGFPYTPGAERCPDAVR